MVCISVFFSRGSSRKDDSSARGKTCILFILCSGVSTTREFVVARSPMQASLEDAPHYLVAAKVLIF